MMLSPKFELLRHPIYLSLSKGETDFDRKLHICDLQDTGYSGDPISIEGLKVLGVVPLSEESTTKNIMNILVSEKGILRTLSLTFN